MRILLLSALSLAACKGGSSDTATASGRSTCESTALSALQACVVDYSDAAADCLATDGALCATGDAGPDAALAALDAAVEEACLTDGLFGLDAETTRARLQHACASESDSLAWRAFGGPQAAVWDTRPDEQTCLSTVHASSVKLVADTLDVFADCAEGCTDLDGRRAALEGEAASAFTGVCGDPADIVAVGADGLADRASLQADCLAAAALEDGAALELSCGPDYSAVQAPRGEWTRVQVPNDPWGAVCGDGSEYSFWLRPAPEGADLDRVFVGLQGGGVCVFEEDCTAKLERAPELFTAEDDVPIPIAIAGEDPADTPFADWTIVYLPYCNQDVFAGGGAVEQLGDLALPRAGAINLRSALRITRDWLWREVDAEGGAGFRSDEVTAFFGGWSAGAYGTLYNTHWILDDLQWPRTTAFPDAGLALDNGEVLGVRGLGDVKIPDWGTLPFLPPYCFAGECAVGPVMLEAISPRLKTVPQQQILLLSNQRDQIQQGDAYFQDEVNFINTMRAGYCSTKELPGVHWYLTSDPESVHVVTIYDDYWNGTVDGVVMSDWFRAAVDDPDSLSSHAEEGDFVEVVPGVEPFPCEVGE